MSVMTLVDAAGVSESSEDVAPADPVRDPSRPDPHALARAPGIARRLVARFGLLAFGLYHVPLFLNAYPTLGGGSGGTEDGLAVSWGHVFGQVGYWIARRVFHLTEDAQQALSGDNGDSAEEFCRLLLGVVIAALAAAIWTLADRRRPRARWVEGALHVLLRYSIALGLASYAVAKLYPVQFSHLSPLTLETRVGDLYPMSLAWTFMQYSRAYSTIAGILELAVVVLLCFRRTATVGALLCVPVMLNVMLMNLCYGVIVKLFSMMIVLSAIVLVLYEARSLGRLLVLHRAAPANPPRPPFRSRRWNRARWLVKLVVVGGVLVSSEVYMRGYHAEVLAEQAAPLYGSWEVTSLVVNGRELARTAEPAHWRRVMASRRLVAFRLEDDSMLYCRPTVLEPVRTLGLTCPRGAKHGSLRWMLDGTQLRLEGTFDGAPVTASLRRRDSSEFPLLREPFRWIFDA